MKQTTLHEKYLWKYNSGVSILYHANRKQNAQQQWKLKINYIVWQDKLLG